MAENRNVAVVDDFEASKGMVGRIQASAMEMGASLTVTGYMNATLNESENGNGNINTTPRTFVPFVYEGYSIIWIKVAFDQGDDEPRDHDGKDTHSR